MDIDRESFAEECVRQGVFFRIEPHYIMGVAELRSGVQWVSWGGRNPLHEYLTNVHALFQDLETNIEEEIPKIGPAVGDTFKKITGSDKDKDAPKGSTQNSGKSKK